MSIIHQHDNDVSCAVENNSGTINVGSGGLPIGTPGTIPCPYCKSIGVLKSTKNCHACGSDPSEWFAEQESNKVKHVRNLTMAFCAIGLFVFMALASVVPKSISSTFALISLACGAIGFMAMKDQDKEDQRNRR